MQRLNELLGNACKLGPRSLLTAALTVTALGLAATPAAAVPVINTTADQSLGDCSVTCSLRDAVALASSGDTLHVPAGQYVLTLGDIIVTDKSLTIVGDGARTTVLDGNGASRIFLFNNPGGPQSVELTDLSLINGLAATQDPVFATLNGGALYGRGASLTLRRCHLAGNQADSGGAVFWREGSLTIDQCTIAGNLANGQSFGLGGGGIGAAFNQVTITNSTLTGNTVSAGAGGGGAVLLQVQAHLVNVTVIANQAPRGGGLYALGTNGSTITNTIIAGNLGGDCQNVSSFVSDHSLDSDNSCGLTGPGDLPGIAPLLGPLADNGGPTDTHALLAGSPALDAGGSVNCPATDQRGVTRPQGSACDIGAFEAASTPQDQIAALIAQINALVAEGALASNKANPLITKLEQVIAKLDGGQTTAACNQLDAFINQVSAYISNGTLTTAQGQALINATNAIRVSLGC
ncbi:MAG TPA: choice-of-anchor Q domain-containing protein [Thermoanaerobaculia bacterium]|nr:choice-of-anchor Q domain-containing protein [Thermoanaerobaculia bacterium]